MRTVLLCCLIIYTDWINIGLYIGFLIGLMFVGIGTTMLFHNHYKKKKRESRNKVHVKVNDNEEFVQKTHELGDESVEATELLNNTKTELIDITKTEILDDNKTMQL